MLPLFILFGCCITFRSSRYPHKYCISTGSISHPQSWFTKAGHGLDLIFSRRVRDLTHRWTFCWIVYSSTKLESSSAVAETIIFYWCDLFANGLTQHFQNPLLRTWAYEPMPLLELSETRKDFIQPMDSLVLLEDTWTTMICIAPHRFCVFW